MYFGVVYDCHGDVRYDFQILLIDAALSTHFFRWVMYCLMSVIQQMNKKIKRRDTFLKQMFSLSVILINSICHGLANIS